jgi:hypothetical protein
VARWWHRVLGHDSQVSQWEDSAQVVKAARDTKKVHRDHCEIVNILISKYLVNEEA